MKLNVRRSARPVLATAAAAAALLAGGCVSIEDERPAQLDIIGDVQIETTQCAAIFFSGLDCASDEALARAQERAGQRSDRGVFPGGSPPAQLLLAYEVPTGAEQPAVIPATEIGNGGGVIIGAASGRGTDEPETGEYTPSPAYTAALEQEFPTGTDTEWAGYISGYVAPRSISFPRWVSTARFGLPAGAAAGEPFVGPFAYGTVIGYRAVSGEDGVDEPLDCEEEGTCFEDSKGIEQPDASPLRKLSPDATKADTRDLAVSAAGGPVTITAGQSADVPFNVRFAGETSPEAFALTSTSSLAGAAAPLAATFPATKNQRSVVGVRVAVPAGTAPGEHTVELVASLKNKQVRRGTAKFVVTAPAAAPAAEATAPSIIAASSQTCASRRQFTIRLRERKRDPLVSAVVSVNGKKVKTVKKSRITAPVKLTGLPKGRVTVKITAKTRGGKTVTGTRRYRTCAPKLKGGVPEL